MEIELNSNYEHYLNKCRFCLETLHFDQEIYVISDVTRKLFECLSNVELENSEFLSQNLCGKCFNDLKYCTNFKQKILNNQKHLHEIKNFGKDDFQEIKVECDIKEEEQELYEETDYINFADITVEQVEAEDETESTYKFISEDPVTSPKEATKKPRVRKTKYEIRQAEYERRKKKKCCELCGKWIAGYRMKSHVESVHEKVKRFTCDNCGKRFYHKRTLREHLKAELGIRTYECEYCGKMMASNGARLTHIYSSHQKKYERFCEVCGESFSCKIKFDTHMLSKHSNLRPYECDVEGCNKSFCSRASVHEHKKRVHSPDVLCPVCSKVCPSKIALRYHIKIHRERKYQCSFVENGIRCQKAFVNATQLKVHLNIHCDIKNFVCGECGMAYVKPKYLKSHMINIHQKMKIKCKLCSSLMGSKEYYRKHIILHHKELDEESRSSFLAELKATKEDDLFQPQN